MKTRISILLLFFIPAISIHAQWVSKKDTLQHPDWGIGWSIDACDLNTIVFSVQWSNYPEPAKVYLSKNGGKAWSNISPLNSWGDELIDISIIDSMHIWGACSDGKIFSTSNGGINWEEQYFDTTKTKFINYIEMFDENIGIAMGDALASENGIPVFLKTTDGGKNWLDMNKNYAIGGWSGSIWQRLDFVNENTGYFFESGNSPQKLYKTTDGGSSWNETNLTGRADLVKFYNENLGLTFSTEYDTSTDPITATYYFKRTTDGGVTWEEYQADVEGFMSDIEFLPGKPSNVWSTGKNGLYFSIDTGRTWQKYDLGIDSLMGRDIVFTDENHGWLLCDNGNIFYTDNNGGIITGIDDKNYSNKFPDSYYLYQNYPNPFNPSTIINYQLSKDGLVLLKIYDLLGREIMTLVNEFKSKGKYSVNFNAGALPNGVYFYRLISGNFTQSRKMMLLK